MIGMDMDEAALHAGFDRALLTDAEMALGDSAWQAFPNPLPILEPPDAEEEVH